MSWHYFTLTSKKGSHLDSALVLGTAIAAATIELSEVVDIERINDHLRRVSRRVK